MSKGTSGAPASEAAGPLGMDSAFSPASALEPRSSYVMAMTKPHLYSCENTPMESSRDSGYGLAALCPSPPLAPAAVLFYGGPRLLYFTHIPSHSSHCLPVPSKAVSVQQAIALYPGSSPIPSSQSRLVPAGSRLRLGDLRDAPCQFLLVLPAKQLPLSPPSLGSLASVPTDLLAGEEHPSVRVPFLLCHSFPMDRRCTDFLFLSFFLLLVFVRNPPIFQSERHSAKVQ